MLYERNDQVHVAPLVRVATSKKSMLVKYPDTPDDEGVWLPISLIEGTDLDINGAHGHVVIPFWLAEDRGLEGAIIDPSDPNDAPTEPAQDQSSNRGSDTPPASGGGEDSGGGDDRPPF